MMSYEKNVELLSHRVEAGGLNFHYLAAGSGDVSIVLLHGWPQSSHEWHRLIPLLDKDFSVIAPDLPGIGGSKGVPLDFSTKTIAGHIDALVRELKLKDIVLVGHDIGGMVAYSYAKNHPGALRALVLIDAPLPGVRPWSLIEDDPRSWHFGFHQSALPETLVSGHQEFYFRSFYDRLSKHPEEITQESGRIYAEAYADEDSLAAGFEYYRAFPRDVVQSQSQADIAVSVPTLVINGEYGMGVFGDESEHGLREMGFVHVKGVIVHDSGHWVPEEQPMELALQIRALVAGQ